MIIFNLAASLDDDHNRGDSAAQRNIIRVINANDTLTFNEAVLNCLHY